MNLIHGMSKETAQRYVEARKLTDQALARISAMGSLLESFSAEARQDALATATTGKMIKETAREVITHLEEDFAYLVEIEVALLSNKFEKKGD